MTDFFCLIAKFILIFVISTKEKSHALNPHSASLSGCDFSFVEMTRLGYFLKTKALALMGAASFCAGVRRKRYSGQQETAPENHLPLMLKSKRNFAVS